MHAITRLVERFSFFVQDQVQCRFTSTETVRTFRDGDLDFHTAPEICITMCSFCFTSTESIRTIRDGDPKDVHLDFDTAPGL